jgi:TPR repeat protein
VSPSGDPFEQLLAQVKAAAEGVYDILGEIGRSKSGNVVYLAREIESGHLVALKLSRVQGAAGEEFDLNVVRTLDTTLPGLESRCPECRETLPDWDRFCFRCGADLSGAAFAPSADEAASLLEAVKAATVGQYDIVGKMDQANGGGMVFFARDLARNKLVALRLKKDANATPGEDAYSIGETQVFRPLAAELGATQVAPAGYGYREPAPPPPPPVETPADVPAGFVAPAPAPSAPRRPMPRRMLLIGAGAVLVIALIGYGLFSGDSGEELTPEPVAAVPNPPPPAPAVDSTAVVDPPPPPPPVVTAAPGPVDSGQLAMAIPMPADARLTINGRAVRRLPVGLPAGTQVLALNAPGFEPIRDRVVIRPGETLRWRPTLVPVPRPTTTTTSTPPPPPPPPPAGPAPTCARAVGRSDWTAAAGLCRTEADGGDVQAQRLLAGLFEQGHGVGRDPAQAATWYSKAATAGDREAQVRLGVMYRGGVGVKRDDRQAAAWFKQAADGGSTAGMLEYGVALDEGRGVSGNDVEAAQWYRKASDAGSAIATRRLGRLYERGDGVPKNEAEAAELYRKAGDKGDAEGQFLLGRLYKDGKGVPKDAAAALEWFKKAAAQGHREAQEEARKLGG